jgi:hypothetical protein
MKLELSSQIFENYSSSESPVVPCRWTKGEREEESDRERDRRDKTNIRFSAILRRSLKMCEPLSIIVQQDATIYSLLYFCKLLCMFQVVTPPIIRSTNNCNYSIWHCPTVSATFSYRGEVGTELCSARCCN